MKLLLLSLLFILSLSTEAKSNFICALFENESSEALARVSLDFENETLFVNDIAKTEDTKITITLLREEDNLKMRLFSERDGIQIRESMTTLPISLILKADTETEFNIELINQEEETKFLMKCFYVGNDDYAPFD